MPEQVKVPPPPPTCLMRIEAPHYVAGIVWEKEIVNYGTFYTESILYNKIQSCAPIVGWIARKPYTFEWAQSYFQRKGFIVTLTYYP
jgi:hypothetical protein